MSESDSISDVTTLGGVHTLYMNGNALGGVHTLNLSCCDNVSALGGVHTFYLSGRESLMDVNITGGVRDLSLRGCYFRGDLSSLGGV